MKKLNHNSQGFSVGTVILVLIVIAIAFGCYKYVGRMNADNREQAGKLENSFNEGAGIKRDPNKEEAELPELRPDLAEVDIKEVTVRIEPYTVTLTMNLPGTYSGQCIAEVEQPGGGNYRRFVAELDKQKTCQIYIPTAGLTAGKIWEYTAKFNNSDDSVRGTYKTESFTLP